MRIELSSECDFDKQMRVAEEKLRLGQQVELCFRFRGREMVHTERGFGLVQKALFRLGTVGRADSGPKLIGRYIRVALFPLR